jgi:hypothetical protein
LNARARPTVPTAAFEALVAYIEKATPHVDTLPNDDLLLLRSAVALRARLQAVLDGFIDLDWGMFSPEDLIVVEELANANPEWSGAFSELKRAIKQGFNPNARR